MGREHRPKWPRSSILRSTKILTGFAYIFFFAFLGDAIAKCTHAVVPGPIIGMVLLAASIAATRNVSSMQSINLAARNTGGVLLANLGILFVPAGVGVIQHIDLLQRAGAPALLVIVLSTILTIVATTIVFNLTRRLLDNHLAEQP